MNDVILFERNEYSKLKAYDKKLPKGFGCVYVLEYGDLVKIGCTQKPYRRLMALKVAAESYGKCELGSIAILPCCTNYGYVEAYLHNKFSDYRKFGTELFDIDILDLLSEICRLNINYRGNNKLRILEPEQEFEWLNNFIHFDEEIIARSKKGARAKTKFKVSDFNKAVRLCDEETKDCIIDSIVCSLINQMRSCKLPVGKTFSVTLSMEDQDGES